MKKITLSESELTKLIKNIVTQKLSQINEGSADINGDGIISPEELYQHFDLDGDGVVTMVDYAAHVDFHCENPELLDEYRESEEYIEKMSQDREPFIAFFPMGNEMPMMEQEEDEEMESTHQYPVDDIDFELDRSDVDEIFSTKGPMRRFRGSIYVDGLVPETDDREYDRKLAMKIMEYYKKQLDNAETYVGGVGFKQRSLIDPFDSDF